MGRRFIAYAPHAYLLVADLVAPRTRWVLFSAGDLIVVDRTRITRQLNTGRSQSATKGKWLIDLDHAPAIENDLNDVLDQLSLLARTVDVCWSHIGLWPTRQQDPTITRPTGGVAA